VAADNIAYGVQLLSGYWNASGHDFRKVAKAYNGGDSYAADAISRVPRWLRAVGTDDLNATPTPAPDPTSDSDPIPGVTVGNLAYNIAELDAQNGALPGDIRLAAREVLEAAEKAGHHISAVSWFNPASTPEHHVAGFPGQGGVAVDFMIYGDVGAQDFVDGYVWANRSRLGVCWVISRRRIRSTSPGHSGNWDPYSGPSPHTDHSHVNFGHLAGQSGYGGVSRVHYQSPNGGNPAPGGGGGNGPTHPSSTVIYLDKLHHGQTDSDSVRWVQYALVKLPGNENVVPINGTYDDATVASVKLFQKAKGDSQVDGILGPNDLAALLHDAGISNVTVQASSK
jgi:peptidoglycan hydrolase-like protein with peptidoglycan-binding domain